MTILENINVNLLSYLPQFMQEYREIRNIMASEEPELRLLWELLRKVFNNQFIQYCDEEGISKFEEMLGLHRYENDTLEIRIFRVLTYWNDQIPYTWRVLVNRMDQLCGTGNYELRANFNAYELGITTKFDDAKKYDELNNMLKTILPANLGFNSINILTPKTENKIFISNGVINYMKYEISAKLPDAVFKIFAATGFMYGKKYVIGG
nr:MAG TPA: tail protein [Caudoviricetes sp.]